MPDEPPVNTTIAHLPAGPSGSAPSNPFSPSPDSDEPTRALLRSRLLVLHLASLLIHTVLFVVALLGSTEASSSDGPGPVFILVRVLVLTQSATGAVYLWLCPAVSISSLRYLELVHFGLPTLEAGVLKYMALAVAPRASPDPDFLKMSVIFASAVTSFQFMSLIVVYGVLIPNTRRRSLAVVAGMVVVAFVAVVAAAAVNPLVRPYLPVILVTNAVQMFMPALVAVFAATRFTSLHREVVAARREAQQVGPYTLTRKLGGGGMGEVWLATHRLLKRPCAVKFIRPELATNPATGTRFGREVRAVTALTHHNTVRVYDYGRADDGSFYFVMEYLDGPTLEALVGRYGPLDAGRGVYLLRQLCGALAEAHAAGLVHRDLKPGNVLVAALGGQRDVAKLLDFGLVHDLSDADAGERLTGAGVVMGTPAYMCPEQADGSRAVDPRGDIYGLGGVAFFALTGRPPFQCSNIGEYLTAHLLRPAPGVQSIRALVPDDLAAVVARCLVKDPKDRFQTALELDAALGACACASEWSAARAAQWWSGQAAAAPSGSGPPDGRLQPVGSTPNMTVFKDHFSGHAADYRAFRPTYPPELFAFLASVAPAHDLAWDCGTGSGQAAVPLAEHFARVFATDASAEQLKNADPHPNVEYAVAPAEQCPLPAASADLVLVAQALHWFDHDRFYAEVRRVCKPGGVFAALCYYDPSVGPEVDAVLRRWDDLLRAHWAPERVWVDDGYRTIPFPFPALVTPRFELSVPVSLAQFLGYLGTWSAAKQYASKHGADPLERFATDFAGAWGDPSTVRTLRWELALRLGRVE